jgi:hypothetical protein
MIAEIAIAEPVERMIHPFGMSEFSQEADRDPFYAAICEAANAHACIKTAPDQIRSARASQIIAQARTLASMTSRPTEDLTCDAGQMVDDAALLLGLQPQRSLPVVLATQTKYHTIDAEEAMTSEPLMLLIGMDSPASFSRFKDAIVRSALISLSGSANPDAYEPGARRAIREMLTLILQRRLKIDEINDEELIEIAHDILTKVAGADEE